MAGKFFKVFRAGKYPQGEVTEAMLKRIAERYDPAYHDAPLNLNHVDESPRYATVDKVIAKGKELFVSFKDILDEAYEMNKKYPKPSIEIADYDGEPYLRAVTMCNFPQVKGLDSIAFAEGLTEKEKAALEEKKSRIFFTEDLNFNLSKGEIMFSEHIIKLAESLSLNLSNYQVEGDVIAAAITAVQELQDKLGEKTNEVTSLNLSLAKFSESGITPQKFSELQTELAEAKKTIASFMKSRVDDLAALALQTKDITPAQIEGLKKFAEVNFDEAKKFVEALAPKKQNMPLPRVQHAENEITYEQVLKNPALAQQFSESELNELKKKSKTF